MKKYLMILVLLITLSFTVSCVAPVVVAAGAGAGATYSLTTDSVSDNFAISKERAVEIFSQIIKRKKGKLILVSISEGKIDAEIGKVKIYFRAKPLTSNATKVVIKARKGYNLLPDKETAVELFKKFVKVVNG
ncbi:hypothetical protein FHQ18_10240 [Deferribacter autotrophicus]|uniref:DUF3568 family protein n=1 Tax=Deferribacter autotrophicus TaxID=500465 RepID=A0A5A8F1W6_9BACT|nr:hypothetical protein [Deferribacter autotrophicus]KAA0257417.1 hypothetical protein FHQ18_10240 [Deferribacter autotrophicus]